MKHLDRSLLALFLLAFLGSLQGGCINDDVELWEIELEITVEGAADELAPGPLFVELHHQTGGEGALEFPLALIEGFEEVGPSTFVYNVDYPAHAGVGLVVYAWRDLDEDGVLCALGSADEPSGASLVEDFEDFFSSATVTLSQACFGPERFAFPPQTN